MTKSMILPLVFGLVGTAILATFGNWQLQRLEWKNDILAQIDRRIAAAPVAVPPAPTEANDQFLSVTARGTITDQEINVLASVKMIGPGYRIISAFETDGRRLLLDRGFVATTAKNAPRPPVEATITGNLHWPDEISSATPEPDLAANIWFARDIAAMAKALGTEPVMIVLRQTSEPEQVTTLFPVDSASVPNKHLGYAFTWFGLALVWFGMTLFFLWRIKHRPV